jgi:AraC-like DNA-binding protein
VQESQMRVVSLAPTPALRPYIQRFLVVEYTAGLTNKLLPGTGLVAAFRFKGRCLLNGTNVPNALVTGLWDTARILTHFGSCANVLAIFTPTGATAILHEPVQNLFNGTMPLEIEVRRSHLALVEEQLAESPHHALRVRVLERFLLEQLRPREPDPVVSAVAARIDSARGSLRIANLARFTGLSQSALERRFRREVGVSPKKFATLVRMRNVVRLRKAGARFTDVAYAAGYADQSHFIKDFKRFAGEAPESFFVSSSAFC